jgi:uncharacterized protein YjbI with pentapeptide repeats
MDHARRRSCMHRRAGLLLLALALVASCGDDCDVAPAPMSRSGGVHEAELADAPLQALTFDHTAVFHLEPAGTHDGDSAHEEGVDEIPYTFAQPVELTLEVGEELAEPITLVLRDAARFGIARVDAGDAAVTVSLGPGEYFLELRHPHAGRAEAEPLTIFVAPEVHTLAAERRAVPGAAGTATQSDVAKLKAGQDCIGCDLRGVFLVYETIGAANLSEADFTNANIAGGVQFNQTTLVGTIFDDAQISLSLFNNVVATRASFKGAKFSTGSRFQNVGAITPGTLERADFSGASFKDTCFESGNLNRATFAGATFDAGSVVGGSNFAGADLSSVVFAGTDVKRVDNTCGFVPPAPARFIGATLRTDAHAVTFSNVDLTGVDFTTVDLRGVTFQGCTIDETTFFDEADLSGNSFDGVNLSRADLSGAILSETTSFLGATLSDGVAHGINLSGQHFAQQTTQFAGADLSFANLSNADLDQADFGGTNLNGAELIGVNFNFANLHGASLQGARLGVAPGSGQSSAKLRGAYMTDVDLTDADLRSADLTGAHLYGDTSVTKLVRVKLDSANLVDAVLSGAIISGSLTNAAFNNAQLVNVVFNGADLTNAKFDSAYLQGTDFSSALSVAGVTLSNAAVSLAPGSWMFMEQDGTPFTFQYGATRLGAIATSMNVTCPDGGNGPCTPQRLTPVMSGPFPPQPSCVPQPPHFDNCIAPMP